MLDTMIHKSGLEFERTTCEHLRASSLHLHFLGSIIIICELTFLHLVE